MSNHKHREPQDREAFIRDFTALWEDVVRVVYLKEPPDGVALKEAETAWVHTWHTPLQHVALIADPNHVTNWAAYGQKARVKRWAEWVKSKLRVDKAAVRTRYGMVYDVPQPGRHSDVLIMLRDQFGKPWLEDNRDHVQGFTLNDGTFATRAEAAKVAFAAGQLPQCDECPSSLISEMLW
jgi:hypothetical protein